MSTNNPVNYTLLKLSAMACAQTNPDIGINLNGTVAFSVDAWVKFNGLCHAASILSKSGVFDLGIMGSSVVFEISGYPVVMSDVSKKELSDDTWHHICVTYDGGQVRIYIDGEFNVMQAIAGSGQSNGSPYLIGNGLQALLKCVRVYNLALDKDAIFSNMYNPPANTSIVAWFDFSQNPPKDIGRGNLPVKLKNGAAMVTSSPSLSLLGTAYARPLHDGLVNPGGNQIDPYTVQARIYVSNSDVTQQMILTNDELKNNSGMSFYLEYDQTSAGFYVKSKRGAGESQDNTLSSKATIKINTWVNLATVFDGLALSIYIDGKLDVSKTFGPIPDIKLESNLVIGAAHCADISTGTACFQGYISQVTVWDKALSADEVALYQNQTPETGIQGLKALYGFESLPARNLANGHPIGLVDGAELGAQMSQAPKSVKATPPEVRLENADEIIGKIMPSLVFDDFLKDNRDNLELSRSQTHDELATMFSGKELDDAKKKFDESWEKALATWERKGGKIPFALTEHRIEGKRILLCHTSRGSYVAYSADAVNIDDCTMWKIRLVFIIVAGFLDAFFGVSAKLNQKVIEFINARVLINASIRARIAQGQSISAVAIFGIGKTLYDAGLLKDLVRLMVDLGWWALFRMLARLVLKFIGIGAADTIASLATTVISFIKVYSERPASCDPLPKVTLAAIKFNYDTGTKGSDAINIRKNLNTPIRIPEWVAGQIAASSSPAAYVIRETTNNNISIRAKFNIDTMVNTSVEIRALRGGVLGAIDPITVNFANGVSIPEYVSIPLAHFNIAAGGVSKNDIGWDWQYRTAGGSWTNMVTSNHRIFVLLQAPTSPWTTNSQTQTVWTEVLEHACAWATGKRTQVEAATAITQQVNGGLSLIYDICRGSSVYTLIQNQESKFLCTDFLDMLNGGYGKGKIVNCTDCATIVSTFANSIGCELNESIMSRVADGQLLGFKCNKIKAIGSSAWNYPFPPGNEFSYHEVAWTANGGNNDMIFDACLLLDSSNNPWSNPDQNRVAKLPANIQFTIRSTPPVLPFGVPFADWSYRERLAQNIADGIGNCLALGSFPGTQNGRRAVV